MTDKAATMSFPHVIKQNMKPLVQQAVDEVLAAVPGANLEVEVTLNTELEFVVTIKILDTPPDEEVH